MPDPETSTWIPTRERVLWLTAAVTMVLLPHVGRLPMWVAAGFAILALWRVENAIRGVRLPGRWARVLLSTAIMVGIFLTYGTLFGRSAGIAALAVLGGMKLLETTTLRDAYAVIFLSFFLVITNFLDSQSIPTGVYMLLVVIVIGSALMAINSHEPGLRIKHRLAYVATMLVQAAPLMLFLFVLFPRIPGPLWGLPKDAHSATTGLSDSMAPGAISQLSQSTAVAFRVEFDGEIPAASKLYWRGPVFWHTDGRKWTPGEPRLTRQHPKIDGNLEGLHYSLTLEPHSQHWVFALDVPAVTDRGLRMSEEYQVLSITRVRERTRFRLRSFPQGRMTHFTDAQRLAALDLPERAHPRARALALDWRQQSPDDQAVVAKALQYFRDEPFFYTLRPPLLREDPVDEFLFGSRRGFCEHYASAFAVLMRSAGIPARVVTGYQGGDVNPLGDYVIVRQRDAHAWVEVWLDDQGWSRVDPTAAVSPARIELGMDATLPSPIGPAALGLEATGPIAAVFRNLRHGWDAVDNSWNQWVLGYGPSRQQEFLSQFGLRPAQWQNLLLVLLATLALILACIAGWLMRRRPDTDRVRAAYSRFCSKLAGKGLVRDNHEGPRDFAARAAHRFPEVAEQVAEITAIYVGIRYADDATDVGRLEKAISAFRP